MLSITHECCYDVGDMLYIPSINFDMTAQLARCSSLHIRRRQRSANMHIIGWVLKNKDVWRHSRGQLTVCATMPSQQPPLSQHQPNSQLIEAVVCCSIARYEVPSAAS
jgi:hypothetical protein